MPSLSKELRRQLETCIAGENGARHIAESGAEQSIRRLAVDRHEPHTSLTPEERALRTELRAHGRQLGDRRDLQRGSQSIVHLTQAVAYEQWHRLLFARFLAENDLLMHPTHGIAVSLDEVKEIALSLGRDWIEIAAEYAQAMLLREVFRPDDPALRVPLSPEKRFELEKKPNSLPREIFLADDSLGWVYQYWQIDSKQRINDSEVKIGADELSPVTQLFTEDYMVLFLLENTLGAWWTARRGIADLPGYTWTYLRLNDEGKPVAGSFEGWPDSVRELRVLDPCMGSGHFLTFALPILSRMLAAEQSITLRDAIVNVLRDNLFGLELDPRCSQIAPFNLALTAWKLAGHHFELPQMNIACTELTIHSQESEWVGLGGDDEHARQTLQKLYSAFRLAPTLGSLIDPSRFGKELFAADFQEVWPLLETALLAEKQSSEESRELVIAAQGLLAASRILAGEFTLVVTNPPYLVKSKQGEVLREFCKKYSPDAVSDLATVFIDRCVAFCALGGTHATVTPQNWLFLKSYGDFRKRLLKTQEVSHVTTVGSGATSTASWDVVRALAIINNSTPSVDYKMTGIQTDASQDDTRALDLRDKAHSESQSGIVLLQPSYRIALSAPAPGALLSSVASSLQGLATGDKPRFQGCFWEFSDLESVWAFQQGPISRTTLYAGRERVIRWERGQGALADSDGARIQGLQAIGRNGIAVTQMRNLPVSLFSGSFFDNNIAVLVPKTNEDLLPIWAYCSSDDFATDVRHIDKKLSVTNATFGHVPFDLSHWKEVAEREFPDGIPTPTIGDLTQWLFDGNPKRATHPLQVVVCRLAGYLWPRQRGISFPGYPSIEVDELNQLSDDDGILCFSGLSGEAPAAERLRTLLAVSFGIEWSSALLSKLLGPYKSLDDWLRNHFFEEHCELFEQRPFIWHLWDGLKDGFHALVNCHKLDRRNMEKLIYSYLGDWLARQRQDSQNGVEGADTRLAASEHLQSELKKILDGETPYDIFVRWKPLAEQPLGWDPDLNDGVRVNLRPWITASKVYRSAKPGLLRVSPSIKYTNDRGREPSRDESSYPWYAKCSDRINDHHLSLDEKQIARGAK